MKSRIKSFRFAFNGLKIALKEEPNFRIHLVATVSVIGLGYWFQISFFEWIAVLLCIGLVVGMELINSSVEAIADFISPEKNERIKKVKDLSAGAVLISSIIALAVGIIIFGPKVFHFLN